MVTEADTTRIVREWLRAGEDEPGDHILDDVLAMLAVLPATVPAAVPLTGSRKNRRMNDFVGLAIAAAAVVVIAVVGANLMSSPGVVGGARTPIASASSTTSSPTPSRAAGEIDPGPYDIGTPPLDIHVTMPAGWLDADAGRAVIQGGGEPGLNHPHLATHDVKRVVTDVCPGGDLPVAQLPLADVGPTAADLTAALSQVASLRTSTPTDVRLDGYPATRLVLTLPPDFGARCGGPEGRTLWVDTSGTEFVFLNGGTETVYIVDMGGRRLVITSGYRGATEKDIAELDTLVTSITLDGWAEPLAAGRHRLAVDGVRFSFELATSTEDGWGDFGGVSISKSISGPQSAEGIIYWTGFPDGARTDPCAPLSNLLAGLSSAGVADILAMAPGTDLVAAPTAVFVGGRPAQHVVVTIREDLGCDPGYFYSWRTRMGGPFWVESYAGDLISAWIVDVDGTRLFIAAEIHRVDDPRATVHDPVTEPDLLRLQDEMEKIVGSIQFE